LGGARLAAGHSGRLAEQPRLGAARSWVRHMSSRAGKVGTKGPRLGMQSSQEKRGVESINIIR
jgi:hypothetical protein